jgi:DNA-binding protein HU-beta
MNKTQLIERMAIETDLSKAACERVVDAFISTTRTMLKRGVALSIANFGTFSVGRRATRSIKSVRGGNTIKIKAHRVPKFAASKAFKSNF